MHLETHQYINLARGANMSRVLIVLALSTLGGCIVHVHDGEEEVFHTTIVNDAPIVLTADAGVFWDQQLYDDVWYFDASVTDANGPYDVVAVWADVYDVFRGDVLVESFPLYPSSDATFWTSEWLGSSVPLDPFYGGYVVDIVAYDSFDAIGVLVLDPAVYN
jgi:hypothetical protein